MTDQDVTVFGATFLKLRNVFNMRGDKADVRQAMETYFKVLRSYPLRLVEAGADAWLTRGARFPKPAEWLDAIPKSCAAGLPVMPDDDAREYLQARAWNWDGAPCACQDCRQADVTHRLLRYVPDVDADERDVRMHLGDKVVVRGHWAHGWELAGYYRARDAFLALQAQYAGKIPRAMPVLLGRPAAAETALFEQPFEEPA